jgi:hypothetical protein
MESKRGGLSIVWHECLYCFSNIGSVSACAHGEAQISFLLSVLTNIRGVEPLSERYRQNKRMSIMVFKFSSGKGSRTISACGSLVQKSSDRCTPYILWRAKETMFRAALVSQFLIVWQVVFVHLRTKCFLATGAGRVIKHRIESQRRITWWLKNMLNKLVMYFVNVDHHYTTQV